MPTAKEILQRVSERRAQAQDEVRRQYLRELAEYTRRDTILYATAFASPKAPQLPAQAFSINLQDIQGFMAAIHDMKGTSLDLILHSPGGSGEVAEQLVQYLRRKYDDIRAIIPQNAMSAATMLACACDCILMGKHSALGPIDPQVTFPTATGLFSAPAQAILDEFDKARDEIAQNQNTAPLWLTKIQAYPPGFLKVCEASLERARQLVEEWLNQYMFRGLEAGDRKGGELACWLANAGEHKTHGRPISSQMAKAKGLRVVELESDQRLQELVLSTFHATMVTFQTTNCVKLIENHTGRGFYLQAEVKQQ